MGTPCDGITGVRGAEIGIIAIENRSGKTYSLVTGTAAGADTVVAAVPIGGGMRTSTGSRVTGIHCARVAVVAALLCARTSPTLTDITCGTEIVIITRITSKGLMGAWTIRTAADLIE